MIVLIKQVLQHIEPENQRLLFIGMSFISGIGCAAILLSEKYRRKLKVYLHKNLFHHKYDYRKEWLNFTERISSAGNMNKLQEEVLAYYCKTFVRKGAALFLWDNDKQVYEQKSSYGLILSQISFKPDDKLISCFRDNPGWVVNVDELDESQFSHILPKFKTFQVKLCVPFQYESKLEGFLVLGKSLNSNEVLIFEDYDLMKIFARQATSLLLCLKLSAQLSLAKEMAEAQFKTHLTDLHMQIIQFVREFYLKWETLPMMKTIKERFRLDDKELDKMFKRGRSSSRGV
ncbi:MAG: TusE/DsrC/DsvC family sulfur relay protein, partial [Deltaproteobacteria bacterium]|nr:TusE/DsrC/DsvC family sulfur relay protein [Deltaproteobacteria bacterium]